MASVPVTATGSTSERRWWTRASVRSSCGAVVALTTSSTVSPAALNTGAVTAATPGSACRASRTRSTATPSAGVGTSMTTWIGPLNPAPNASARRSYALRWVVSVAALPSSGVPIRMLECRSGDGTQRNEADQGVADRVAADVVCPSAGERLMRRLGNMRLAMDRQLVDPRSGQPEQARQQCESRPTWRSRRSMRRRHPWSSTPGGRRGRARGWRSRRSCRRTSTACPAVAFAVPAESSTLMPSCRCWRWRVTMNSA